MRETGWSEAIGRKYPEPVVLIVSCDKEGRPNVMPAGWSMVASGEPPMLAISIAHRNYTHDLIEQTGEFVLVFPSGKMKSLIEQTGSCSGRNVDKFSKYKIKTRKPKYVKPPLIEDAVACFECRVRGKVTAGDHTIFVGEVLASYISDTHQNRLYNFGGGEFRTIPA